MNNEMNIESRKVPDLNNDELVEELNYFEERIENAKDILKNYNFKKHEIINEMKKRLK